MKQILVLLTVITVFLAPQIVSAQAPRLDDRVKALSERVDEGLAKKYLTETQANSLRVDLKQISRDIERGADSGGGRGGRGGGRGLVGESIQKFEERLQRYLAVGQKRVEGQGTAQTQ